MMRLVQERIQMQEYLPQQAYQYVKSGNMIISNKIITILFEIELKFSWLIVSEEFC